MTWDFRWLLLLISNIVLFMLTGLLNDTLASSSLYIFPAALGIYYPATVLNLKRGIIFSILTGIIADSIFLLPLGTCTLTLPILFTLILTYRNNLKFYSLWHTAFIIHSANFILYILMLLILSIDQFKYPEFYWATVLNLLSTHIFLIISTNWFIRLQQTLYTPPSPNSHEPNSTSAPASL